MRITFKVLFIAAAMIFGLAAATVNSGKLFEISKNLEIFTSVYKELNTNFVDELDPSTMMRKAIDAMTNSLDPYTNFVSESQVESYWINDDEKYQGIGARVGMIDQKYRVLEPYENGPAYKAGIKAGDEIVAIDGIYIQNKKLEEINAILRGLPGTIVNLKVKPFGKDVEEQRQLTRGEVNIPNVPYSGFVADGVGYISLTIFTQNAGENISKAYKELKDKNPNMSGLILDLRSNGGGLLHEAINIGNIFLPSGETLVTTKGKIKERDQSYKTLKAPLDLEIPLVVLINKKSASASEIVSGVIQDFDRGVIIGQRSFGKGLVQNTRELPYNARLKITTSKYYIPSGRCIQGVEYENGEPKDIPDNLRSKYKTKNGRIVLDGGGITPDIKIEAEVLKPVTQALLDQQMIFEYVNQYCIGKDSIEKVGKFKFTDFQDFLQMIKKKGFSYQLESEKNLEKLKQSLTSDQKPLLEEIQKMEKKMEVIKQNDLSDATLQIIDEIEKEIVSRYYFQKGKVQQSLDDDKEVMEAIAVLRDSNKYKSILSKR